jgi:zinc transport system substrate-binding protein
MTRVFHNNISAPYGDSGTAGPDGVSGSACASRPGNTGNGPGLAGPCGVSGSAGAKRPDNGTQWPGNTGNGPEASTSPARLLTNCMFKGWGNLILLAGLIFLLAACSERAKDDRPVVSVSILPQKYVVERIAGDNFRVNVLVPPGASPETYEPSPGQMRDVANSMVYFRIGYIDFERTILTSIMSQNNRLLAVNTADGMDLIASDIVDHGDHMHLYGVDPHIWLSVPGVISQARIITETLAGLDPENQALYLDNFNRFATELDDLHESFEEMFNELKRRSFLVFHPALGYFARDYKLNQIAVEQDGKSPTAANMRSIVNQARQEGIRDIFIQMEFERESAIAVARELGGSVIEINPLSENWPDAIKDLADKLHEVLNR